jgi:hypothetical protein
VANVTFSGPIRVGTQRDGGVTQKNTGTPLLAQTAVVPFGAITTAPTAQNLFTLPAGAKIVDFKFETVTAISGGSVSAVAATLGRTGTANAFLTSLAVPLTATRQTQALVDAQFAAPACNNIGTTDVTVTGTFTATGGNPTAGSVVVTVLYMQRLANGGIGGDSGS